MEEKEFNFNEEMMPCEEALEKKDDENITENREDNIQKIISKIFKRKNDKISKEHKDKKNEQNDNENYERANMYEKWYRKEKEKRYEIQYLISKYYDKHIQELEKSVVEKNELINKIYEIINKY